MTPAARARGRTGQGRGGGLRSNSTSAGARIRARVGRTGAPRGIHGKRQLKLVGSRREDPAGAPVAGIAAVLAAIYFLDSSRGFFSEYSRQTLLHQVALFGVLSIGAALAIISGRIDLLIGSVVALASIVSAKLLTDWLRGGPTGVSSPSTSLVALAIARPLPDPDRHQGDGYRRPRHR